MLKRWSSACRSPGCMPASPAGARPWSFAINFPPALTVLPRRLRNAKQEVKHSRLTVRSLGPSPAQSPELYHPGRLAATVISAVARRRSNLRASLIAQSGALRGRGGPTNFCNRKRFVRSIAMNRTQRIFSFLLVTSLSTGILTAHGGAQQPAASPSVWAAPAQPQAQASSAFQSACGNQPMCYDAPDFAVSVVDFRMSTASGYKLMDATLRFVNKTNQPLILGYLDGSAVALDDQGNRYAPYGNRGLAGIGLVNGASADPKFVLQPGGAGDARWELLWRPGAQDPIGSAFDLSLTIREVNTLVGGQHALGGEVPLRFQGLANGMTGSGGVAGGTAAGAGTAGVAGASPVLASNTSGLPACGPS